MRVGSVTCAALAALMSAGPAQAWGRAASSVSSVASSVAQAASPVPGPNKGDVDFDADKVQIAPATASVAPAAAVPYDGLELKFMMFTIRPGQHKKEGLAILAALVYLVLTQIGTRANKARAKAWFEANRPTLMTEFSGNGMPGKKPYDSDGGDEFLTYATGRRGVDGAHVKIVTEAYHDLIALGYNWLRPIADVGWRSPANKVTIVFNLQPAQGTPNAKFVFAISKRTALSALRDERWDVRTFTSVTDSSGLDASSLIVQTESGEVTNALVKDAKTAVADVLKPGARGFDWFESLVISDMPAQTPDEYEPKLPENQWKMTLSMRLPPASRTAETAPLIELACNLVDVLYLKEGILPAVSINKLKKKRADKLEELLKPIKAEKAEEAEDSRAALLAKKRRLDQEKVDAKLAAMTPQQRMKYLEKEKEKEQRKKMAKMSKKVR